MEDGLFTAIGKRKISELNTRDLLALSNVEASGRLKLLPVYSKERRQ
jgi:hypothetical protein